MAGRKFKDIEEANTYALHWCRNDIAQKPTRTTGQSPWDKFIKEEKALLKPLPAKDYECPVWQEAKVHRDHHIVFKGSFYSVPSQYIGKKVWVRAGERILEIYFNDQKIKTHVCAHSRGQWVTDKQDYPKRARAFLEKDRNYCLNQAQTVGHYSYQLLNEVLKKSTYLSNRKAQAILRLGEKYGTKRLEEACQRALSFENIAYRSLKRILVQGLEKQQMEEKRVLCREASYLRHPQEFYPFNQEVGQ